MKQETVNMKYIQYDTPPDRTDSSDSSDSGGSDGGGSDGGGCDGNEYRQPIIDDDDDDADVVVDDEDDAREEENAGKLASKLLSAKLDDQLKTDFEEMYSTIKETREQLTVMMRTLRRRSNIVRSRLKQASAATVAETKAKPNGLSKPCSVSKRLCDFMDVPNGTQVARSAVTKYLHKYIRDNELYMQQNRHYIVPDPILRNLLDTTVGEPVHIIHDLQKKMNEHFQYEKSSAAV